MAGLEVRTFQPGLLKHLISESIAKSLFAWRGDSDGPSDLTKAQRMGALLREMAHDSDPGGQIVKGDLDHGMVPLSDAEIFSLYKLWQYSPKDKRSATGVTSQEPFEELDRIISGFETQKAQVQARFEAWKKKTGGPDADHLFANGILDFVSKSGVKDIAFWHSLATDFHDMFGDHLDAVFWILERPECDRATAWHFIAGFVSWECLRKELSSLQAPEDPSAESDFQRRLRMRSAYVARSFEAVIRRWNEGFYRFHSLAPTNTEGEGFHGFSNADVDREMSAVEEKYGLGQLLRPVGLDVDLSKPKDDMSRSTATHLDWIEGVGLQLTGDDWFKPEWHPDRFTGFSE